ncbi:high mobility group b protein 14 [Quercus suber]|uniref:High mobility group b protein 14 n=1 Tax=Quercus suber TaxID=58331 RepID=A0AAW0LQP1_QUESU
MGSGEDFRKESQEQNPAMRDIGKASGDEWKTMTYEKSSICRCFEESAMQDMGRVTSIEEVQYYDIATEKRAEFDRAMTDYIKRKAFWSKLLLAIALVDNKILREY